MLIYDGALGTQSGPSAVAAPLPAPYLNPAPAGGAVVPSGGAGLFGAGGGAAAVPGGAGVA
eukprot:12305245-Alexandrium_andersonii.AAC.1